MLFQGFDDRFDHVAVGAVAAFYVDVRLGIHVPTFRLELLKRRLAIVDLVQQRPCVQSGCPSGQQIHRRIEPDGDRPLVQQLPSARIDEDLASGRNHPDLVVDQPRDQSPLAVAEIRLAEPLEHLCRRVACRILDGRIGIDEGQVKAPREPSPDGRFAGPHQADKDEGTIKALNKVSHIEGYTAGGPGGKSPCPICEF